MPKINLTIDTEVKDDLKSAYNMLGLLIGVDAKIPEQKAAAETADEKSVEPVEKKPAAKKTTAAAKKATAKKPEPKEEPEEALEPESSMEDVRQALKDYAAIEGRDKAIGLINAKGAASVSELSKEHYDEIVAICKKATEAADGEDDDEF